MKHLEVSCAVRPIWWPLGVKWLTDHYQGVGLYLVKVTEYSVTLTRYRPTPWWWPVQIETCRSTYFVFWTVHFHNSRKNRPTKCTN